VRGLVDPVHQFMLGITLEADQLVSAFGGEILRIGLDPGQRDPAVDPRLTLSEQVQVRTV